MAIVLAVTACGPSSDTEPPAAAVSSSTVSTATSTTARTVVPSDTVPADAETLPTSAIPTDPAGLGPCPIPDDDTDGILEVRSYYSPAQLFPVDIPAGLVVIDAYSYKDRSDLEFSDAHWTDQFLITNDDRVVGHVSVGAVLNTPQSSYGEPNSTLRGVPATVGQEMTLGGPTTRTEATWSDSVWDYRVLSSGLSVPDVEAFINRLEIVGDRSRDPTGQAVVVGRSLRFPTKYTLVDLGPSAETPSDRVTRITVTHNDDDPDRGIGNTSTDLVGLRLGALDGRRSLSGTRPDGINQVITTTRDGHTIDVTGPRPVDELETLAASTAPISVDDPQLSGVRLGDPNSGLWAGVWCNPEL
ncbi:hypothetical protein BH10ACT3_BH10ACT3_16150 [soil metagenome]